MTSQRSNTLQAIALTLILSLVATHNFAQQPQTFVTSVFQSSATGWKPDTLDRGIGILYFTNRPGYGLRERPDTIVALSEPKAASSVVGHFVLAGNNYGWTYSVASEQHLQPNILEFGNEECGIPFDTILAHTGWARAVLGFEKKGNPFRGWVRLDSTRVRFLRWSSALRQRRIFFLPETKAQFYDRPNGRTIDFAVTSARPNYIMHPLDVRTPWMRVRVARPADVCVSPGEVHSDTLYAWIRYLDRGGRPRVWYYTRGC